VIIVVCVCVYFSNSNTNITADDNMIMIEKRSFKHNNANHQTIGGASRSFKHAFVTVLLLFCFCSNVNSQAIGGGSYAGYRVRQNCDPAGGTTENERIDATLNFALCCSKAGTGPKAELSPCCNNCVQQFALYFDYSYPCWTKQGGEVMQEKTENQIDKNFFVWDTAYYRWKCAGGMASVSNFVTGLVIVTVMQQIWEAIM
jgi:hypothetical protein